MDLHNKFLNSSTLDVSILSNAINQNSESLVKELINAYDKELLQGTLNTNNMKFYHMLLCSEYQSKNLEKLPQFDNSSISDLFLKLKEFSQEHLLIIYEITILKLISDPMNICKQLENFQMKLDNNPFEEKETRHLYMKMIECFLDAFRLLKFLSPKAKIAENLSLCVSKDIKTWYKNKDDSDWKSLISLLPKLIENTGLESLNLLWELLLQEEDLKNSLTGLCIFINSSLEKELQEKDNLFIFFSDKRLWEIVLKGLKSRLEIERKQALYLFKIITEFLQKRTLNQKWTEEIPKIPFTCNKNSESISLVRNNYILILESLEEKKQHMVLPSLKLLNYLVSANVEHQKCGNCFGFSWLSCIFKKILQHENNTVVKLGMSYILKMNPELYDDNFIKSLAVSLNNRFLYENEDDKNPPKIIKELENLLIQAEDLKVDFTAKFVSAIADISWDPISIFYITFALSAVENKHFSWKEDQLIKITNLVEKNLNLHSPFLRKESQKNTIIAITHFTEEVDLKILGNVLSAFPEDEVLSRSSKAWKIILDWLEQKIKESEVEKFIHESCKNIRDGFLTSIESFARVFVILCDLNLLKSESKILMDVIDLLYNIQSIKSRPYGDFELADRILELIYHFSILTNSSEIPWKIVSPYFTSALDFLLMNGRRTNLSYENVKKYSAILNLISKKLITYKTGGNLLQILEEEAIYSLQNANSCSGLQRLYGINILQLCQESRDSLLNPELISLLLKVYTTPLTFEEEESLSGTKGKTTTEYYTTVGKIINSYLEKGAEISENWICHASALFDKAGTSGVPFVIGILSEILGKGLVLEKDLEQVKFLIRTCWKSIFKGKKNRLFWVAFDKLLKLILNPTCFEFQESLVHELISEILKEGEAAPNLKIEFLKNLEDLDPKWLFHFQEAILDCLLHGQILRRDTKIELQTLAFLSRRNSPEMKDQRPVYMDGEFYLNHNLDSAIRARAVTLFNKAITLKNYPSSFFPLVIRSLKKFKGKRYFGDSNSHRIRQRIFQVLLLLEPVLDEDCTEKLRKEVVDIVLSSAADQPSIQIMMSWILSRIYLRTESDQSSLWNFFKEVKEKRPGNVKFVAGVILQISKLIKEDNEHLKSFLETSISHLAPECLGPTFNTRLACQIILVKLYEKMQDKDNLYKAIVETLNQRNFQTVNEFYYDNFNLLSNYSLQSIFYEVPRLTNMSEDELIPPTVFTTLQFSESKVHPLKLLDESNSLSLLNTFSTKAKSAEKSEISNNDFNSSFDLQKKIVPQKSTIFENQESDFNENNMENEAIIVVASLIERVPNLGGIARTCEVFGARELVLGNKKCTENKEFQSLSVTAEKWIKVTEVKPHELSKYLLEMKDKDWKLVGLEQTAYSSSLLETKFEKKTVLVLGNEKDGIPPHLIPILDTCVEIPQIGVIRSLNVHVTAAICVWEYAKQHSFK